MIERGGKGGGRRGRRARAQTQGGRRRELVVRTTPLYPSSRAAFHRLYWSLTREESCQVLPSQLPVEESGGIPWEVDDQDVRLSRFERWAVPSFLLPAPLPLFILYLGCSSGVLTHLLFSVLICTSLPPCRHRLCSQTLHRLLLPLLFPPSSKEQPRFSPTETVLVAPLRRPRVR